MTGAVSAVNEASAAAVAAAVAVTVAAMVAGTAQEMAQEMAQVAATASSARAVAMAVVAATNAVSDLRLKKVCAPRMPMRRARTTVVPVAAIVTNAGPKAEASRAAKGVANHVVNHGVSREARATVVRARSAKPVRQCRSSRAQPKRPWPHQRSSTRCPVPTHRRRSTLTANANRAAAATAAAAGVGVIVTRPLLRWTARAQPRPLAHRTWAAARKHLPARLMRPPQTRRPLAAMPARPGRTAPRAAKPAKGAVVAADVIASAVSAPKKARPSRPIMRRHTT